MNEDLLMELSDCASPEGLAQIIHRYIPQQDNGATNLPAIAKAVGVKIESSDSSAYEGLLITDPTKSNGIILYKKDSNAYRKRFTVAHELGHFLLPYHNKNAQCASSDLKTMKTSNINQKKEAEANRFAIELLAPQQRIKAFLKAHSEPDMQQILDLQKAFKISKEAAARCYCDYSDHNVAIIFGKGKTIRYILRNKEFPYINLETGECIPEYISQQFIKYEAGHITDWYYADHHYFFSNPENVKGKELFCQTAIQENGFHISLLSFDDE